MLQSSSVRPLYIGVEKTGLYSYNCVKPVRITNAGKDRVLYARPILLVVKAYVHVLTSELLGCWVSILQLDGGELMQ